MATLEMITEAIAALKDSKGSTVPAITKWIESEKEVDVKKRALTQVLKKGTDSGVLVKDKDLYSLAPEGGDSDQSADKDAKKVAAAEKKAAAAAEKEAKKAAAAAEKEAKKAAAAAAKEEKKKAAAEKKAAAAAAKAAKKKEKE